MDAKSTSFIQFKYCNLCKTSHKHKNKKHVYSKKHQEILTNILAKFKRKIDQAAIYLTKPDIHKLGWESDVNVWCYFCDKSVSKHEYKEDYTVICGNFLQHLSLSEHSQKMNEFFWENIIDKKKKELYVLTDKQIKTFEDEVKIAVERFKNYERKQLEQNAGKIKLLATKQHVLSQQYQSFQHHQQQHHQHHQQQCVSKPMRLTDIPILKETVVLPPDKSTLPTSSNRTHSSGLTIIPKTKGSKERGNIFTGAIPPWLRQDIDDDTNKTIGPTLTDYENHLKSEKKKKLPANRVGANFKHGAVDSSTWLPSFGGVWSNQRRLNNKQHFEKRMKITPGNSLPVQPSEISNIKPYKRKAPETVTSHSLDELPSSYLSANMNSEQNFSWDNHNPKKPPGFIVPYKRKKVSNSNVKACPSLNSDSVPIVCDLTKGVNSRDFSFNEPDTYQKRFPGSKFCPANPTNNPYNITWNNKDI